MAQTAVSGAIAVNTHWTAANGPYLLSADVTVQNGAVLTVDAGVTIYMGANARFTVQTGSVQASGTASNPIRVLSDQTRLGGTAAPGDWQQWVFSPGTLNTRLDHVQFEHGSGLAVLGSSPVFNYLKLTNHQGPAISIDLAASPVGVGNQASGNTVNGIAVPHGDIVGSVNWGLRGIPYVVASGVVSVGKSPSIQTVTPNTAEQGQALNLTVSGVRLDGMTGGSFDRAGLSLSVLPGSSSTQANLQLTVDPGAAAGPASLRLQVDAGEVLFANAITVVQPVPAITGISPSSIFAGAGLTEITVTGRNFTANSEVLFNSATVATRYVSATELRGTLPNQTAGGTLQTQVRTPDTRNAGQYLLSNAVPLTVLIPVPPTVSVEPAPIALPPDNKPHTITIRLSKPDYRDNTLSFSISDTTKATASPASVVIPAGQTTAQVTILPLLAGTASFNVNSATLTSLSVPLFITTDFRGVNTAYSPSVGVVIDTGVVTPAPRQFSATSSHVGVSIGAILTGVTPTALALGDSPTVTVFGVDIPSGAQVSLLPATGVTPGTATVSADGKQLDVVMQTAADAPLGARRLVVKDANGQTVPFAEPAKAVVQVVAGLPAITSIEPMFATPGSLVKMIVHGRNLQGGMLRVLPATGILVDSGPQVSADGSTLTANLDISAAAPTGSRLIQVESFAGATQGTFSPANTFTLVSAIHETITPIASSLVGVVVGNADPRPVDPVSIPRQPLSPAVGVLVGGGVNEVLPKAAVVGNTTTVTVRGGGLQGISGASLAPNSGLTVGFPTVNADGTEAQFTVQVDTNAALGLRRLLLTAGSQPIPFANPADTGFLISAPIPELASVAPQVLLAGQSGIAMTVRGRNLLNVSGIRVEPATGVTVTGPFVGDADGSTLNFNIAVAAGSPSGSRTVIVTTVAGDSSTAPHPGNTLNIANQFGSTYQNFLSSTVGVLVGSPVVRPPQTVDSSLTSALVGVVVGNTTISKSYNTNNSAVSDPVGLIVGSAARALTPNGWLQGATGTITVTGNALNSVTDVAAVPATGVVLGSPVISADGSQMTLPITVAADAPQSARKLRLGTASGALVPFTDPAASIFAIGSLPTMTSITPIVLPQGTSVVLNIRGSNLQGVTKVAVEPADGVVPTGSSVSWSQDTFGEQLTVTIQINSGATLGDRVVRLLVPGGVTSATATPANSVTVVPPQ